MATQKKNLGGRPSTYSQELADTICAELALGKSMRTVLKEDSMPAMSSVFKWLRENPEFSEQYARAKEESSDALVEEMLYIADEEPTIAEQDKEGNIVATKMDSAGIARNRLRVDTRKWIASKLKPKKYGETTRTEITGKDGDKIQMEIDHVNTVFEDLIKTVEKKLG